MKIRMMAVACVATLSSAGLAHADGTLAASYHFDNSLASSVGSAPDLTLTDPLGTSHYFTDTVFGHNVTVLHVGGASFPVTDQGGLTFDNSGGLITHDSYSVALSFKFEDRDGAWRRIIDVENRQSDNGFYVDPSNQLDIFPVSGSAVPWVNNVYQNVVLTVGPSGPDNVHAYLQGVGSFTVTTNIMDITNANNPDRLINLFLDNVIAGGQQEWSAADIAVANFYDGELSQAQVDAFNRDPLATGGVPEPGSWAMLIIGFSGLGVVMRRRRATAAA